MMKILLWLGSFGLVLAGILPNWIYHLEHNPPSSHHRTHLLYPDRHPRISSRIALAERHCGRGDRRHSDLRVWRLVLGTAADHVFRYVEPAVALSGGTQGAHCCGEVRQDGNP